MAPLSSLASWAHRSGLAYTGIIAPPFRAKAVESSNELLQGLCRQDGSFLRRLARKIRRADRDITQSIREEMHLAVAHGARKACHPC